MFMPKNPPVPSWQGAELAFAVLKTRLEQIKGALQPPRPDVIDTAVRESLEVLHQLERFWHGQPPGSDYYARRHKRLPPSGGSPTQQEMVSGEQAQLDREWEESQQPEL